MIVPPYMKAPADSAPPWLAALDVGLGELVARFGPDPELSDAAIDLWRMARRAEAEDLPIPFLFWDAEGPALTCRWSFGDPSVVLACSGRRVDVVALLRREEVVHATRPRDSMGRPTGPASACPLQRLRNALDWLSGGPGHGPGEMEWAARMGARLIA